MQLVMFLKLGWKNKHTSVAMTCQKMTLVDMI